MRVLAIDPGPKESGFVIYDSETNSVMDSAVMETGHMPRLVGYVGKKPSMPAQVVAIEMIASYGMAVGKDVFETCVWIGRMIQAAAVPDDVILVYRKDVKMCLCGSPKAKDANIRQALIDRVGPQGTKKNPGPTYGVKSHAWAALAVAVTVAHGWP